VTDGPLSQATVAWWDDQREPTYAVDTQLIEVPAPDGTSLGCRPEAAQSEEGSGLAPLTVSSSSPMESDDVPALVHSTSSPPDASV
jgi:hypothetical protein